MSSNISLVRSLLVGSILGAVFFSIISLFVPNSISALSGLPARLKIPSISIDAPLESVGLTPEGAMDVPKDPLHAAWFNLGPRPGEIGSAVIDGHFGWENGMAAVFDNLHKLEKGDKIFVQNDQGATITFVVSELRTYGEHDDTSHIFISRDGKSHLNLITCKGTWNNAQQDYSERLVVFADAAS